jgi:hypothetical protein
MRNMILAIAALTATPAFCADWHVNLNLGAPAPYYGYAPADVVYVERYVPAYDVPRVFTLARHARVRPAVVVDMYRHSRAWAPVNARFGATMHAAYAPLSSAHPRGHAYGHYKVKAKHGGRHRH